MATPATEAVSLAGERRKTAAAETARRNALEKRDNLLTRAQDLETRMQITRWTPGDDDWKVAEELVELSQYRRCVDQLESLVVARMFELSKMNMSRTGASLHPFM